MSAQPSLPWMSGALAALFLAGCTGAAEPDAAVADAPPHLKTIVLADAQARFDAPSLLQLPGSTAHTVTEFEVPSGLEDFRVVLTRSADGTTVGGGCRLMRGDAIVVERSFGDGEATALVGAQPCRMLSWDLAPGTYRVEYIFGEATAAPSHSLHVLATGEVPPWLPALR